MPDPLEPATRARFGPFLADFRAGELFKNGRKIRLQGQPLQVLALLIENPGEVVTREHLRQKLWPEDTFVDFGHGLNSAINRLREALNDSAEEPRFIETLPRRGYRFIAKVQIDANRLPQSGSLRTTIEPNAQLNSGALEGTATAQITPGQAPPIQSFHPMRKFWLGAVAVGIFAALSLGLYFGAEWHSRASAAARIRSVAVLPLENLSGDPAQDYFVDGMTDALITDLAQISGLQVISRTSAMQYKGVHRPLSEIAKRLSVDAVVEGTVARSATHVHINAQLIDAHTDRHLWAKGYEREISEIVSLQHEVARTIVVEIEGKLTPQGQKRIATTQHVDPEAYQLYLKGRYFWNKRSKDSLQKAIVLYQEALDKDGGLAPAYAGIADCYVVLGAWNLNALAPADAFPAAKSAALKALEIDPDSAEARTELSSVRALYEWDWPGAERESKIAIQLSPGYALAHQRYGAHLAQVGRFDEAIAESKVSQQLDPLSLMAGTSVGERFFWARRYDEGIAQIQRTLELDRNFVPAHFILGQIYEQKGMLHEAIAEFEVALRDSNQNAVYLAALGHAYAVSGQRTASLRLLEDLRRLAKQRYVSEYGPALIYVGLGEKDNALESLEKAYQEHSIMLVNSKIDPRLDPLRSDPQFQSLLHRIGLVP